MENYNVFKGIKQVFASTYSALTNSEKDGYLWFVREDSATTVGDIYFGVKKYAEAIDISTKANKSEAISSLSLTMDNEYKLTLSGRTADGSGFTVSDVIDLPLETMVVSGAYDSANTQIVLTLKNGSTTSFPVSALVDGLQSEITAQNTLSADLISDGTTNKVVTGTDKTNWNNAYASAHTHSNKSVLDGIAANDITNWNNAYASAHTHSNKAVLDDISSSDVDKWDAAIQGITFNGETLIPDTANTVNISAITFDGEIEIYGSDETPLNNVETPGVYKVVYLPAQSNGDEVAMRGANPNATMVSVLIVTDNNGRAQQAEYFGETIRYRWEYSGSIKSINWVNWVYFSITDVTGNMDNWNEAYGKSHTHDNWSIIDNITSADTENWDNAYASAHTHSNKSVLDNLTQGVIDNSHTHSNKTALDAITTGKTANWDNAYASAHTHTNKSTLDGISSTDVTNWNNAASSAHSHSNSTVLDNLTQTVIDNSHTHSNKTALDTITTGKTQNWDNAYASAHTHSNKSVLDNLTQGVINSAHTHTNKTVLDNLTQTVIDNSHTHSNSAALNAITTGKTQNWDNAYASAHTHSNKSTLDSITSADVTKWNGVTGKTDSTTFGTHSATTISNGTSSQMHLPTVSESDNNKVLMVVDGVWTLVTPSMIYSGSGVPDNSQGNNGDLYIQTS